MIRIDKRYPNPSGPGFPILLGPKNGIKEVTRKPMYGGPKNGKVKITMKPTSDGPSEGD